MLHSRAWYTWLHGLVVSVTDPKRFLLCPDPTFQIISEGTEENYGTTMAGYTQRNGYIL
jgi:hypothetical protein